MTVTVKLRYLRHSPRKLRPVLAMLAGQKVESAIAKTSLMAQDSALALNKALKSALAAAKDKQFEPSNLVVSQLFATDGPKIKRIRANARGRTNKYVKHVAHLTVMLSEIDKSLPVKEVKPKVETVVRKKK